jgi:NADP-dependent 3-hydroxy acid dehydrogenase YdfG
MSVIQNDLDGKVALVTGASSGIGESTAKALSEAGANVALAARREDELEALADRIETDGGTALVIPTDVTDEAQIQEMIDRTHEEWGRLDILVNNAGVMLLEPIGGADTDNFRRMVELNLLAVMNATHEVLPIMQEQGEGHIVNISSVAGRKSHEGSGAYSATKFGVNAFSEALREEVTGDGIRVTMIEPGAVDTELQEHIPNDEQKEQTDEMVESLDVLTGDDIARSITYAVTQPQHVDVNEILIRPTQQEL